MHGTLRPVNVLHLQSQYTWQCRWRRRIFSSLPEYSWVLHHVCMTGKLTRCVTCKVYWNVNGPTNPLFTEYTRNFICLKCHGDWWDSGQIQTFTAQWLIGHFTMQICQDVRLILKIKIHTGPQTESCLFSNLGQTANTRPCWKINSFLSEISVCWSWMEKITIKIERAISVFAGLASNLSQLPAVAAASNSHCSKPLI